MILNCWKNFPKLGLKDAPKIIECFISLVSELSLLLPWFALLLNHTERVRRYKIKSFEGNDDFRGMEEVVFRRYGRLKEG